MIEALRQGDAQVLGVLCARHKERAFQRYLASLRERGLTRIEM